MASRASDGGRGPVRGSLERFRTEVRQRAQARVSDTVFRAMASAARLHPLANPERHQVEVVRDVPYLDDGHVDHRLDVYRPTGRPGPHPVVLYVHGGGFSLLSKDTHWAMALVYARYGYLVFNISYRLAPRHPFPAAICDTLAAYEWVIANAASMGGDLSRLVVAGESAGANLVTALSVATSYRRPEPWAARAFDLGVAPRVAVPACGIFQVSDAERFARRRRLPYVVRKTLEDVASLYLRGADRSQVGGIDLADPLLVFERGEPPERPLPAFFLPVGTRDPLLDDTRRMRRALDALGVPVQAHYYRGEIHAFHALMFRGRARECWTDIFAFLDQHLGGEATRVEGDPDESAA
ncbi:MAG TPA: alpha/beta hydrolase fold domain-containing protein [Kofleriaceae bacterium]|jgi:acetyl esterase|nr:alpha/beta hydrolase fold domain-containing protein [Kofleriaceae bacterium]